MFNSKSKQMLNVVRFELSLVEGRIRNIEDDVEDNDQAKLIYEGYVAQRFLLKQLLCSMEMIEDGKTKVKIGS